MNKMKKIKKYDILSRTHLISNKKVNIPKQIIKKSWPEFIIEEFQINNSCVGQITYYSHNHVLYILRDKHTSIIFNIINSIY